MKGAGDTNSLYEETKGMVLSYPSRVTCQERERWGWEGVSHSRIQVHPSVIESRDHWAKMSGQEIEQERRGARWQK